MEFTRYHSLRNILDYPGMEPYLNLFFSKKNLAMFPEDAMDLPLAQVERFAKCRWDAPFFEATNQLLDATQTVLDIIERKSRRCMALWEPEKDWTPEKDLLGGKQSVFLLTPEFEKAYQGKSPRPAVILCPGGGYERICFSGEGNPVMRYMEAHGYVTFVLKYRVTPNRYPMPQEDLALAVYYVRKHAHIYGIDPQNIMAMGFSAGAHLCASLGCFYEEFVGELNRENTKKQFGKEANRKWNTAPNTAFYHPADIRPDKLCLAYPVISFEKEYHKGSFQALTGEDESLQQKLSLEKQVSRTCPPVFLWACKDDTSVPFSNAVRMADALQRANVPHMLQLYPQGGHGCNLAFGTSAHSWTEEMLRFFSPACS